MDKSKRLAELLEQQELSKQQFHQLSGAIILLKEQIKEDEKSKEEPKKEEKKSDTVEVKK